MVVLQVELEDDLRLGLPQPPVRGIPDPGAGRIQHPHGKGDGVLEHYGQPAPAILSSDQPFRLLDKRLSTHEALAFHRPQFIQNRFGRAIFPHMVEGGAPHFQGAGRGQQGHIAGYEGIGPGEIPPGIRAGRSQPAMDFARVLFIPEAHSVILLDPIRGHFLGDQGHQQVVRPQMLQNAAV